MKRKIGMFHLLVLSVFMGGVVNSQNVDLSPEILKFEPFVWQSETPEDCPFISSEEFNGIKFLGLKSGYRYGDTWYPTWASNDTLYSPWTDGQTDGMRSGSGGRNATTGQAIMIGSDPLNLKIKALVRDVLLNGCILNRH